MKLQIAFIAFSLTCSSLVSCQNKKTVGVQQGCTGNTKFVRKATNEAGTFIKEEVSGQYAIRVVTPKTVDEQKVYLICNPPSNLPKIGRVVTFSGTITESLQVSALGGLTFYDIVISSIK